MVITEVHFEDESSIGTRENMDVIKNEPIKKSSELNLEEIEKDNVLQGEGRINETVGGKQVSRKNVILKYSLKGKKKKKAKKKRKAKKKKKKANKKKKKVKKKKAKKKKNKVSDIKESKINKRHLDGVINSGTFLKEVVHPNVFGLIRYLIHTLF